MKMAVLVEALEIVEILAWVVEMRMAVLVAVAETVEALVVEKMWGKMVLA